MFYISVSVPCYPWNALIIRGDTIIMKITKVALKMISIILGQSVHLNLIEIIMFVWERSVIKGHEKLTNDHHVLFYM